MSDIVDQYNSARLTPAPAQMLKDAIDEVVRLRAENNKLMSAYNNGYHDALEAAAELAWKILTEIEGIDFEVPAKIRELHAAAIRESGDEA